VLKAPAAVGEGLAALADLAASLEEPADLPEPLADLLICPSLWPIFQGKVIRVVTVGRANSALPHAWPGSPR
jgi:hypothetical protein